MIGKKYTCISKKCELSNDGFSVPMRSATFIDEYDNLIELKLTKEQHKNIKLGSKISVEVDLNG